MSFLSNLRQIFRPAVQPIQEIIGRINSHIRYQPPQRITVDHTEPDHEFWDRLRFGKEYGYEIGGLFARPMTEIIAAWSFGDGLEVTTGNDVTDDAIEAFLSENLQELIEVYIDSLALGNAYLVMNADGSMTPVPASMVTIETDPTDFRRIVKATIRTLNQETGTIIEDVYTETERTLRVSQGVTRSTTRGVMPTTSTPETVKREEVFPNPFGRVPIVHFANDRTANEVYGRPYYDALLTLFAEYDDVIRKGLDGVKIMGNPIPTVSKVQDAQASQDSFTQYEQPYEDHRGVSRDADVAELSPTEIFFTTGEFSFEAPGNFTPNTKDMLKKLFQVMLQHSQIPEWAWGGAIASSMASVEAQRPAFNKVITGRRRKVETPMKAVVELHLTALAQFTPGVDVDATLRLAWPSLEASDRQTDLEYAKWLDERGYITRETALRLSGLVEDAQAELDAAINEPRNDKARAEAMAILVNDLGVALEYAQQQLGYDEADRARFERARVRDEARALRNLTRRTAPGGGDEVAA